MAVGVTADKRVDRILAVSDLEIGKEGRASARGRLIWQGCVHRDGRGDRASVISDIPAVGIVIEGEPERTAQRGRALIVAPNEEHLLGLGKLDRGVGVAAGGGGFAPM